MGLLVTDRKFFSQLANGESFSLNTGDFGIHTKGSVMERLKAVYQLDVSWESVASDIQVFTITNPSALLYTFTREVGSFIVDGFANGDTLDFDFSGSVGGPFGGTVTFISPLVMTVDFAGDDPGVGAFPAESETSTLRGTTTLEGFILKFGLIGNNETINFTSKVEGSEQGYSVDGLQSPSDVFTIMDPLTSAGVEGWRTGTARAKHDSAGSTTYVQRFILEHEFVLVPYFIDGELSNLQNLIAPSLFDGNASIKYAIQSEFRNVLSNPNTAKIGVDDQELGSVGWFNENYNGFPNEYSITSIAYEDASAASAAALLVSETTTVTVVVASANATFVDSTSIFGVYVSLLPDEVDYTGKTTVYQDNFVFENKIQTVGSGAVAGTIITDLSAAFGSASEITITFDVTYTVAQQLLLDATKFFAIGIQVADTSLSTDLSDKVMLLADVDNYVKSADIEGLLTTTKMEFIPHPFTLGVDSSTDYKGWLEDGVLLDSAFTLDKALGASLSAVNVKVVAWKAADNTFFELDDYSVSLSSEVIVTEGAFQVQEFNLSTDRGFPLLTGDQFNQVELATGVLSGDDKPYTLVCGFKLNWQDWVALPDADTVFFDNTLENDGLNKNSSRYSLVSGYAIRCILDYQVSDGTSLTNYISASPDFDVRDYDLPATDYTAAITLKNQGGTDIGASILQDENTKVEALFDQLSGAVTDLSDYTGVIRIASVLEPAFQINELSTLRTPPSNNVLTPIAGETLCKMSIVGGDVLLEADIDFTQIDPAKGYRVSARLFTNTILDVTPLLNEDGTGLRNEDGSFLFAE